MLSLLSRDEEMKAFVKMLTALRSEFLEISREGDRVLRIALIYPHYVFKKGGIGPALRQKNWRESYDRRS